MMMDHFTMRAAKPEKVRFTVPGEAA